MIQATLDKRLIVRQRLFPVLRVKPLDSILAVARMLQLEKFTGKLVVNLSQGAVNSVQAEDSASLVTPAAGDGGG